MEDFISANKTELFWTAITFVVWMVLRLLTQKTIRRIGNVSDFIEARTLLISKYASIFLTSLSVGVIVFIWGVNFKDVGLLFSSIFAVIGVALFAQWSILSNVTAGVILFFSFPFKIGDRIKILDKEIIESENEGHGVFVIEDIKAFHVHLRKANGALLTYPNNMMLQKGVVVNNNTSEVDDGSEIL